jgi:hypothetical protein
MTFADMMMERDDGKLQRTQHCHNRRALLSDYIFSQGS